MIEWLVALGAFFPLTAIYLGGMRLEPAGGGGLRQVLGLVLTLAVYLAVWRVLHGMLAGIGPVVGGVILATAISILALPFEARIGYLLVGVKLQRTHAPH
jgi:hypothetical protein